MRLFGSIGCWFSVLQEHSVLRKISLNTTGHTQNCVSPVKEITWTLYSVEEFNLSPQSQLDLLHRRDQKATLYSF